MCLVAHQDDYRRVWMFPRNIRSIRPWKMAQIASLFKTISSYDNWSGNQDIQDNFCKLLEDAGLKRAGDQYDPHSGGPRTYKSQLECLGLLFVDDGKMHLTQLGDDLASGKPPLAVMQKLLMRMQYPSCYGANQNVRMNFDIKVKPVLFVLELLLDGAIGYLTNEEFMVPVVYGHNRGCLGLCKEKIQQMREGASFDSLVDTPLDIYMPRSQKPMNNVRDIANTLKNYLEACCLVSQSVEDGRQRVIINHDFISDIMEELKNVDEFITYSDNVSFQRRYGARNIKDTRSLFEERETVDPMKQLVLSKYYEYCGTKILTGFPDELIEDLYQQFGINKDRAKAIILPHIKNALNYFEATFLELSVGGIKTATDFEKAVCMIFNDKLKFDAVHTGQKHRIGRGGYADVFAVSSDGMHCAIIDAKASPGYNLPSDDHAKMISNYIPNYKELAKDNCKLEFASYVAGGYRGNIESNLKSIESETGVGCSCITAFELLELAKKCEENLDQEKIRELFSSTGQVYASSY